MEQRFTVCQAKPSSYNWFRILMLPNGAPFPVDERTLAPNPGVVNLLVEVGSVRDTEINGAAHKAMNIASGMMQEANVQPGEDADAARQKLSQTIKSERHKFAEKLAAYLTEIGLVADGERAILSAHGGKKHYAFRWRTASRKGDIRVWNNDYIGVQADGEEQAEIFETMEDAREYIRLRYGRGDEAMAAKVPRREVRAR